VRSNNEYAVLVPFFQEFSLLSSPVLGRRLVSPLLEETSSPQVGGYSRVDVRRDGTVCSRRPTQPRWGW